VQLCPIPTLASNSKLLKNSKLQNPEEAVPVKVPVKIKLAQNSISTAQQLGNHWR
jgi:hypothetical protein